MNVRCLLASIHPQNIHAPLRSCHAGQALAAPKLWAAFKKRWIHFGTANLRPNFMISPNTFFFARYIKIPCSRLNYTNLFECIWCSWALDILFLTQLCHDGGCPWGVDIALSTVMVRLGSPAFFPQRIGVWFESVCLVPERFLFLPPPRTSIKRAKPSIFTTNMCMSCERILSSGEDGGRKPMVCSLDAPGSKNGACQSEGYKDTWLQSRFPDWSRSI